MLPFFCEEDSETLLITVGTDLIDITAQVPRRDMPMLADILHRRGNGRGVDIVESIQELLDGTPAHLGPIIAPPPLELTMRLLTRHFFLTLS